MQTLSSYVRGEWVEGDGPGATLVNPTTEEALATTSTAGVDMGGALAWARDVGGASLRAMTFGERGAMLGALAQAVRDAREELLDLSTANGGATRGDAKFDVDGAAFTLASYAELGERLGDARLILDGESVSLGRTPRWSGQHIYTSRPGVAIHINAFNFPAWGLAEKAAAALLAGMPVVSKPATATSLVSWVMMRRMVDTGALPKGALSLICGGVGDLLDHVQEQDVLAFTGSGDTAASLRSLRTVVGRSVAVNVEADSLNAAILGPDVTELISDTGGLFVGDVVRDMTQKAGQKCTAIRRIVVPEAQVDDVCEALAERLGGIRVGDPAASGVRVGPVATRRQHDDVRAGIDKLAAETDSVFGGSGGLSDLAQDLVGVDDPGKGYFVGPVLRRLRPGGTVADAPSLHAREVFGPVATVIPYDGTAGGAAEIVRLGAGGLVASGYTNDRAFAVDLIGAIAPWNGRLYLGSDKVVGMTAGPGTVLPSLLHGGPGRAGGGEELGGPRGMTLYMQRTAVQADQAILRALAKDAVSF